MGKTGKVIWLLLLIVTMVLLYSIDTSGQQQSWTLLYKIQEGKLLLKNSPALEFVEKNKVLIRKQVALAILNIETGEIIEKRYWLDSKDISRAAEHRKKYLPNHDNLPRFMPVDPVDDFEITTNYWNSWASDLSVNKINAASDTYIVVADKYLIANNNLIYEEDKTGPKYSDIVFSPPSDDLHTKEIVDKGRKFINYHVESAFYMLYQQNVRSKLETEKKVSELIDPIFVKNILINEQTDPNALLNVAKTFDEQRRIAEKVLLRYGLNEDKAYRYTVSFAGAMGPAQIMRATYRIVQNYQNANLILDEDVGRVNLPNAILAQILVFDDHWATVAGKVNDSGPMARKVFNGLSKDQIEEGMAMVYNGGPGKYNRATGGLNKRSGGYKETLGFLQKFRVIKSLNLFD